MATKSFTTEMKFSIKSVDNLLIALGNNNKPNIDRNLKSSKVSDISEIRKIFSEKDNK